MLWVDKEIDYSGHTVAVLSFNLEHLKSKVHVNLIKTQLLNYIFHKILSMYKNPRKSFPSYHRFISVRMKRKRVVLQASEQTGSDILINICHLLSVFWCSLWWGCLLWVNGDGIDTVAKWSVLPGDWFHLQGSFFFFLESHTDPAGCLLQVSGLELLSL